MIVLSLKPRFAEAVYGGTLAFLAALRRHPNMMGGSTREALRNDCR